MRLFFLPPFVHPGYLLTKPELFSMHSFAFPCLFFLPPSPPPPSTPSNFILWESSFESPLPTSHIPTRGLRGTGRGDWVEPSNAKSLGSVRFLVNFGLLSRVGLWLPVSNRARFRMLDERNCSLPSWVRPRLSGRERSTSEVHMRMGSTIWTLVSLGDESVKRVEAL